MQKIISITKAKNCMKKTTLLSNPPIVDVLLDHLNKWTCPLLRLQHGPRGICYGLIFCSKDGMGWF